MTADQPAAFPSPTDLASPHFSPFDGFTLGVILYAKLFLPIS